jgi:hypothetical protein
MTGLSCRLSTIFQVKRVTIDIIIYGFALGRYLLDNGKMGLIRQNKPGIATKIIVISSKTLQEGLMVNQAAVNEVSFYPVICCRWTGRIRSCLKTEFSLSENRRQSI